LKPNAKILILEDEPLIRLMLASELEQAGALVVETEFCADALRLIRNTAFDLAILDYRLSDGYSLDMVRTLRAESRHLPVLLLSGESDSISGEAVVELSLLAVLPKPPEMDRLMVFVRQIIGHEISPQSTKIGRYMLVPAGSDPFPPAGLDPEEAWLAVDCSEVDVNPPPKILEFLASAKARVAVLGAGSGLREQIVCLNRDVDCVADAEALAALSRRHCVPGERAALLRAAVQMEEK
jgi:DNA-binding NarL/FixJ family response regulator